jgi:hypothetical protein
MWLDQRPAHSQLAWVRFLAKAKISSYASYEQTIKISTGFKNDYDFYDTMIMKTVRLALSWGITIF